tara:strand:- start:222 stop:1325 length:1104 start_codon:yes stop_codon:yes gene_type:complete
MNKAKIFSFYLLAIFIFLFGILVIDFIISNTLLKQNHCVNYQEFFYELKKNCKGKYRFKTSFPLAKTYTDKNGLRVKNHSVKKDKDKKNIFMFGDSMTYGVGLEYDKTFVGIIDNKFKDYNVYNFGLSSYSSSVYLFQLKNALKKNLRPEKIFIFLDLSDFRQDAVDWYVDEDKEEVRLFTNDVYLHEMSKNENFKDKNFKVTRNIASYLNYNFRNLRAKINMSIKNSYKIKKTVQANFTYTEINNLDSKYWSAEIFKKGKKTISQNFLEIKNLASKYDFQIFLVVYPWIETIEYGQEKFNWSNFAKEICNEKNCKTVDTIPKFIEYKNNNKNWVLDLYFLNDVHFNENGSKIFAKMIMDEVKNFEK